ncbi:MAG: guanylate kinase, partial [Agathobacter rectalis]|nr:guanylate kinase [Agathobacter rectalis]
VQFDIILDDAIHNVLETPATYPVLMRKPWNSKMTGLLSVNNITEFVYLVEQIINASLYRNKNIKNPSVVALVGPSGSGKTALSDSLCAMEQFENPKTYCTKPGDKHRYLTEEEFNAQDFFEKTRYAGIQYGTKMEDIEAVLAKGHFVVMPLDMCGAIAMKRHFPTVIVYVARDKELLIRDIIEQDYSIEEKTLRILSIDAEKRNRQICDYAVNNMDVGAATRELSDVLESNCL